MGRARFVRTGLELEGDEFCAFAGRVVANPGDVLLIRADLESVIAQTFQVRKIWPAKVGPSTRRGRPLDGHILCLVRAIPEGQTTRWRIRRAFSRGKPQTVYVELNTGVSV